MKVFVIGAGVAGLAFASFAEGLDVTAARTTAQTVP